MRSVCVWFLCCYFLIEFHLLEKGRKIGSLKKSGYNFHIDKTVMLFDRLQLERKQLRYVFKE